MLRQCIGLIQVYDYFLLHILPKSRIHAKIGKKSINSGKIKKTLITMCFVLRKNKPFVFYANKIQLYLCIEI